MSEFRRQAVNDRLRVGSTIRFTRTFTREDVEDFGRITRDYNPVHYEHRWVELKGFRAPICHGLLVGSMLCEPGGQWGWLATGMVFRFLKPVYPGDTVSCEMTIQDLDARRNARAVAVLKNQRGETVMNAELTGYLPDAAARALLETMLDEGDPTNPLGP